MSQQAVIKQFLKLFWRARESQPWQEQAPSKEHTEAVEYAREHGLSGAEVLLAASGKTRLSDGAAAIQLIDAASKVLPTELMGMAEFLLGVGNRQMGKFEDAVVHYNRALQSSFMLPYSGLIHTNLGNVYSGAGDFNNAVKEYSLALSDKDYAFPGYAYYNLGYALQKIASCAAACDSYRKALQYDLGNSIAEAHYHLAECLFELQEWAECQVECDKALNVSGVSAVVVDLCRVLQDRLRDRA